jgi:hypothetical protein
MKTSIFQARVLYRRTKAKRVNERPESGAIPQDPKASPIDHRL